MRLYWYNVSNPIQIQANHVHHPHCNSNEALVHSLRISMFLLHNPSNSFTQSSGSTRCFNGSSLVKDMFTRKRSPRSLFGPQFGSACFIQKFPVLHSTFFSWFWLQVVGIITPYKAIHMNVYTSWWFQAI